MSKRSPKLVPMGDLHDLETLRVGFNPDFDAIDDEDEAEVFWNKAPHYCFTERNLSEREQLELGYGRYPTYSDCEVQELVDFSNSFHKKYADSRVSR